MSDYTMSAEVLFKADKASKEAKGLSKNIGGIRDEADKTSRKGILSLNRLTVGLVGLGAAGSGAFAMMTQASPELQSVLDTIALSMEEVFMILGDKLAPIIEDTIVPAVEKFVLWFEELDEDTQTLIASVIGLTAFMIPLTAAISIIGIAIGVLLSPIGLVILAIAALYLAWDQNVGDIRARTEDLKGYILSFEEDFNTNIASASQIFDDFTTLVEDNEEIITRIFEQLTSTVGSVISIWSTGMTEDFGKIADAFSDFVTENEEDIATLLANFSEMWENIEPIILFLEEIFADVFGDALVRSVQFTLDIISALIDILNGLMDIINGIFEGDWERVFEGMQLIFKGILNIFVAMLNSWISQINDTFDTIEKMINKIPAVDINFPKIPKIPTFHEGTFGERTLNEGIGIFKPRETVRTETQENALQRQLRQGGGMGNGGAQIINYNFPNARYIDKEGFQMFANQMNRLDKRDRTRRGQP